MKKLILLLCVFLFGCSANTPAATSVSTEEIDYEEVFDATVSLLNVSADAAEFVQAITYEIWGDAIYERKYGTYSQFVVEVDRRGKKSTVGFNTAIANFHADKSYEDLAKVIEDADAELRNSMRTLKDAPDEYQDAFEYMLDAYGSYTELSNLALNPSGSYNTYGPTFQQHRSDFDKAMQKVDIYRP